MTGDWRTPFLELKPSLRLLYDANLSVHHAVLLSTNRTGNELQPVIEMLEPAYRGQKLVKVITVDTIGCAHHSHLFFASDRGGVDQLARLLDGIESWMDKTPGGFIPGFAIPTTSTQTDRNLIRWISIVYYLAWASDAPYLDVEIEYEMDIDHVGFFPWTECPQPPRCQPLDWLIHRSLPSAELVKSKQKFEERGERIPDVIDAYLTGELIASSMAAIDILAYVMHGERKEKAAEKEDYATDLKKKKTGKTKESKDADNLKRLLLFHHNPWENTVQESNPQEPLTWRQIADKLGWKGTDHAVQSRVNRGMERIFGAKPMEIYKQELLRGIRSGTPRGTSILYFAIVDPEGRVLR